MLWRTPSKSKVLVNLLNNAFHQCRSNRVMVTCSQQAVMFWTVHTHLVSGGTNSNRPATAADLNETSLEAAIIQILLVGLMSVVLLIAARPKFVNLVIPPAPSVCSNTIVRDHSRTSWYCR